eukprot:TRINITY_DN2863_c1_g2_i6.p1 TRINITY_DN2863_c1_g2~~TRINITY_DN2863_c1_g2_i6.p1  ORF type:complete len:1154 (+),score=271.49 TRINITY_DN2863_c1_g2_i6:477-3464(+)
MRQLPPLPKTLHTLVLRCDTLPHLRLKTLAVHTLVLRAATFDTLASLFEVGTESVEIKSLDLSQNAKLAQIPENFFRKVPGLTELSLADCGFRALPRELTALKNLRRLNVDQNKELSDVAVLAELPQFELLNSTGSMQIPAETAAKGPESVAAYVKALAVGDGKTKRNFRGKIMILGEANAGTTTFANSLLPMQSEVLVSVPGIWSTVKSMFVGSQAQEKRTAHIRSVSDPTSGQVEHTLVIQGHPTWSQSGFALRGSTIQATPTGLLLTPASGDSLLLDFDNNYEDRRAWRHTLEQICESTPTEGIEIRNVTLTEDRIRRFGVSQERIKQSMLSEARGDKFEVALWDLGGQPELLSGHTLFLSRRAVYVVLWSANPTHHSRTFQGPGQRAQSQEDTLRSLRYWLSSLAAVGLQDITVFILASHIDCAPPGQQKAARHQLVREAAAQAGLSETQYQYMEYSISKRGEVGVKEVRTALLEAVLKQKYMGEAVPTAYMRLATTLRQHRLEAGLANRGVLEWPQAQPIIRVSQLEFDRTLYTEEERLTALESMHVWSECAYFRSAASDLVVVDPHWLTNTIWGSLMKHVSSPASGEAPGVVHVSTLRDSVWRQANASTLDVCRILHRCGLLFPFDDAPIEQCERVFVVAALSSQAPPLELSRDDVMHELWIGCNLEPHVTQQLAEIFLGRVMALVPEQCHLKPRECWRGGATFERDEVTSRVRFDSEQPLGKRPSEWFILVQTWGPSAKKNHAAALLIDLFDVIGEAISRHPVAMQITPLLACSECRKAKGFGGPVATARQQAVAPEATVLRSPSDLSGRRLCGVGLPDRDAAGVLYSHPLDHTVAAKLSVLSEPVVDSEASIYIATVQQTWTQNEAVLFLKKELHEENLSFLLDTGEYTNKERREAIGRAHTVLFVVEHANHLQYYHFSHSQRLADMLGKRCDILFVGRQAGGIKKESEWQKVQQWFSSDIKSLASSLNRIQLSLSLYQLPPMQSNN